MTYRQILEEGTTILSQAGIEEASNDAWLLMADVYDMDRTRYLMHGADEADEQLRIQYMDWVNRRANHEPLQYIQGKAYFMGLEFEVRPGVLIPRFDTEVLVEEALKYIKSDNKVLDMCTGSGCIALSIGVHSNATVTGVDISDDALAIAENNKVRHSADNVSFIKSNMFDNIDGSFDYIISNPPYIRTDVIEGLASEVKSCEPMLALDGHEDGLFFYRILAKEGIKHLNVGGALMMEIGYDQAEDVSSLLRDNNYADIRVIKDLAGLDRVVCGWRK